jgi:hypothetical protein
MLKNLQDQRIQKAALQNKCPDIIIGFLNPDTFKDIKGRFQGNP